MNDAYATVAKEDDGTPILHVSFYFRFANIGDRDTALAVLKETIKTMKVCA